MRAWAEVFLAQVGVDRVGEVFPALVGCENVREVFLAQVGGKSLGGGVPCTSEG